MDAELAALASTAATTVVRLLTGDGWEQAKKAVGSLWRRVHPDRAEVVEAELVETRAQVLNARQQGDERTEQDLVSEWSARLRRLLAADPQIADELGHLVDELRRELPETGTQTGHLEMGAHASGQGRVYQAGRDQHITER